MHSSLAIVNFTEESAPEAGLLAPTSYISDDWRIEEKDVVSRVQKSFSIKPDYIFFRRFNDGRSSQIAAYGLDNSNDRYTHTEIMDLHWNLWLSGQVPLLYVGDPGQVRIFSCIDKAPWKNNTWNATPFETIKLSYTSNVASYSTKRLADGTFWEDRQIVSHFNYKKGAHNDLLRKVLEADKRLNGKKNYAARHILILTLLLKYLEDRGVFPKDWYKQFYKDANSCLQVFKYGGKNATFDMFQNLENKFNGDIFKLNPEIHKNIDNNLLTNLADLVCNNLDPVKGQYFLWDYYSFKCIPIEVLSHIYEHFTDRTKGAIFTPQILVDLILDQVMPFDSLKGNESILDPACGSGIFLVSAFKRLIQIMRSKNGSRPISPEELITLLSKSIYGIELQKEASELTSFSLALAICDALQPNVIWNELKFKKILTYNIFNGDYAECIDSIKIASNNEKGFDIIIGNPPFQSKLSSAMAKRRENLHYSIPDNQSAYFFLIDCSSQALKRDGKICLIQNAGFIYNRKTNNFKQNYFSQFKVDGILDFVSIHDLFKNVKTKVIAVLSQNKPPSQDSYINHWVFRRTYATKERIGFELDYYDYNYLPMDLAKGTIWAWRANLLGGGRIINMATRLSSFPTFKEFLDRNQCHYGNGFIKGNPKKAKNKADWLVNINYLPATKFISDFITENELEKLTQNDFQYERPRDEELYAPPLLLIKQVTSLPCAYWDKSKLAFGETVFGIHSPCADAKFLKNIRDNFILRKHELKSIIEIFGAKTFISKNTALNQSDLLSLPWPENVDLDLSSWEKVLLEDISKYMVDYVNGIEKSILLQPCSETNYTDYIDIYIDMIRVFFPKIRPVGQGKSNGLRYQLFQFYDHNEIFQVPDDWFTFAKSIMPFNYCNSNSLSSIRILRIYHNDFLLLIKPDLQRYWLKSVAIRDVDDTISDMLKA